MASVTCTIVPLDSPCRCRNSCSPACTPAAPDTINSVNSVNATPAKENRTVVHCVCSQNCCNTAWISAVPPTVNTVNTTPAKEDRTVVRRLCCEND